MYRSMFFFTSDVYVRGGSLQYPKNKAKKKTFERWKEVGQVFTYLEQFGEYIPKNPPEIIH